MFTFNYVQPGSLQELLDLLAGNDGSDAVMAGGTDLLLRYRSKKVQAKRVLSLDLPELQQIEDCESDFLIGASVTLSELIRKFRATMQPMAMLVEAAESVGSCQTRNLATIGGNFCTGNASSDMATALLAANASVIIRSAVHEREMPLDQFFISNRKIALESTEIVTKIRIPKPSPSLRCGGKFIKIGKRRGHIIAALNGAATVQMDDSGIIQKIYLAVGTLAPRPIRLYRCEEAIRGHPLTSELLGEVSGLMLEEINPRDSLRASKEFRTDVAPVVLRRIICAASDLEVDK